ncbi:MAG: hypothetical protein NC314_05885 [Roseburia sp.]|nr:hypothetical protein [Ruminococcus sp.]MCM1153995.1 hypothetical protein [Roseburia sp.]MCM1242354.1 hypothetical protein [Roseburia sp.]
MKSMNKSREELVIKMIFSIILFMVTYMIIESYFEVTASDFPYHANIAAGFHFSNLKNEIMSGNTYFMWSALVGLLHRRGWVTLHGASAVVTASANVVTLHFVMDYIKRKVPEVDYATWIYFGVGAFFVGPLFFPWINKYCYVGAWSPNPWHNPTNNMVRPFAMLSVILILDIIEEEKADWKKHVLLSISLTLSMLAKPSFLQGIAPAMALYVIIETICMRKLRLRKYLLLASTFIPAVGIMLFQLWLTFYSGNTLSEGIEISYLEIVTHYVDAPYVALLACIAFPLFVLITAIFVQKKEVLKNPRVLLMFSYLFASWCEMAFLFEKGRRGNHGNFAWAYMLALFVAFVLSGIEFIDITNSDFKYKEIVKNVGIVLFTLHLLLGIWYICMMPQHNFQLF